LCRLLWNSDDNYRRVIGGFGILASYFPAQNSGAKFFRLSAEEPTSERIPTFVEPALAVGAGCRFLFDK
jgi:hypothetical protein